ncbi:hypothetical protein JOC75_000716 [Metabacillus crassostreae]|nr:hypothetical protein [Metabacillus crassostreae]
MFRQEQVFHLKQVYLFKEQLDFVYVAETYDDNIQR